MRIDLSLEGAEELEQALLQMEARASKAAARRALKKALEPVRSAADSYTDRFKIVIGTRLNSHQRRRAKSDFAANVVSVFVGPVSQDGSSAPEANLFEFGTAHRFHDSGRYTGYIAPEPYMRPAWDANVAGIIPEAGRLLWAEITK